MYIVLVYDVSQEDHGTKRWSKIFKTCKRYLTHIQNSVFEGEISRAQLASLQTGTETVYRSGVGFCYSLQITSGKMDGQGILGAEKMT